MKVPPRLLDTLEDQRARRMLASWAEEEPPPATLHKAATALGLAAATVVVTGTSATAATLGSSASAGTGAAAGAAATAGTGASASASTGLAASAAVAAKWIGAGIVGGALAVGTAHYASSPARHAPSASGAASSVSRGTSVRRAPSSARERAAEPVVAVASEPPAPANLSVTPPHAAAGVHPSVVPTPSAAAPDAERAPTLRYTDSMAAELTLIDQTRQALSQGDPNAALATLRRYDQECNTAVLAREATVLRVQALFGAGRTAEAVSLGARFIAEHPDSPHAANLRRLLGAESRRDSERR